MKEENIHAIKRKHVLKAIKVNKAIKNRGNKWLKDKGYFTPRGKRNHTHKSKSYYFVIHEWGFYSLEVLIRKAYKIANGKRIKGYPSDREFRKQFMKCGFPVKSIPENYHALLAIKRDHIFKAICFQKSNESWWRSNTTHFVLYEKEEFPLKVMATKAYNIATKRELESTNTIHIKILFEGRGFTVVKLESTLEDKEFARGVEIERQKLRMAGKSASPPKGQENPKISYVEVRQYERDRKVVAWVLENADGVCEVCKKPAPFDRDKDDPYLEAHHVRPLAECGPDTIYNVVACCPNCHQSLHHAIGRDKLRNKVISRIDRLQDYPATLAPIKLA